jgi:hypothetical protein
MRHKKQIPVLIVCLLFFLSSRGQELYNLTLPASVPPKGVLGVRLFNESYNESGITRNISALKLMYGVTSKFSLTLSGVAADYHSLDLPVDFIKHDHSGKGPVASAAVPAAVSYPYLFAGTDLYGQYRFLSNDGQNTHFRMAAYGEASYIRIASHLAEPDLMEHNSGVGAGLIATYLRSHFAGTLTVGGILPFEYKGNSYDIYGGQYPVTFRYGNAVKYDLALGYLLFPRKYRNYKETNVNVYVEFLGKTYGAADVTQQDGVVTYHIPNSIGILEGGSYVEVSPGVQCIIRSDVRVEFSLGMPLINSSYLHEYPIYYVAMQKYFFFHKRPVSKND